MAGNEGKLNDLPGISARLAPPNRNQHNAINSAGKCFLFLPAVVKDPKAVFRPEIYGLRLVCFIGSRAL